MLSELIEGMRARDEFVEMRQHLVEHEAQFVLSLMPKLVFDIGE
jgi:hypothetical protein